MNRIEIGGNTTPREGYIQVDVMHRPDVLADIRALPFRGLDEVYASHVLEHLPNSDVVPALKEMRRALKPEGCLEVWVPDLLWTCRKFATARSQEERWGIVLYTLYGSQEDEGQYHKTGFTPWRLIQCMTMAGFRQISARRERRSNRAHDLGWRAGLSKANIRYSPMEIVAVGIN